MDDPHAEERADNKRFTELTLQYFAEWNRGRKRPDHARLEQNAGIRLSTAVALAFERKLVRAEAVEISDRDPALERRLKKAFPKLETAIVVSPHKYEPAHKQVAERLAWEIGYASTTFPLLRDGMKIGLGSGRGLTHFAESDWWRRFSVSLPKATLLALTGRVFSVETGKTTYDADSNLSALGERVKNEHQKWISCSIGEPEPPADLWMAHENFAASKLDIAIFGVGLLNAAHRFVQVVEQTQAGNPTPEFLIPIYAELEALVEKVRSIEEQCSGYWCCGDICNRAIVIPWPEHASAEVKKRVRDDIAPAVRALNDKLITVTKTQLQKHRVRGLCIVAGKEKSRAVWYLLKYMPADLPFDERPGLINTLAIDVEGAQAILEQTASPDWEEYVAQLRSERAV